MTTQTDATDTTQRLTGSDHARSIQEQNELRKWEHRNQIADQLEANAERNGNENLYDTAQRMRDRADEHYTRRMTKITGEAPESLPGDVTDVGDGFTDGDGLMDDLTDVGDGFTDDVTDVGDGFTDDVTDVGDGFTDDLTDVGDGFTDDVTDGVTDDLTDIVDGDAGEELLQSAGDQLLDSTPLESDLADAFDADSDSLSRVVSREERKLQHQIDIANHLRSIYEKNGNENLLRTADRMEDMAWARHNRQLEKFFGPLTDSDALITDPLTDSLITDPLITDPLITDPLITDPLTDSLDPAITDPAITDALLDALEAATTP